MRRAADAAHHQAVDRGRELGRIVVVGVVDVRLARAAAIGDLHAEYRCHLGHPPADPAEPQDAEPAAGERRGQRRVALLRPAALAHVAVVARDAARHVQQQSHAQLGHALGQHVRRVGHAHALAPRRLEIDRIDADAEHTDDLELGQGRERHALGAGDAVGGDAAHSPSDARQERINIVLEPQLVHGVRFLELGRGARVDVDDLEELPALPCCLRRVPALRSFLFQPRGPASTSQERNGERDDADHGGRSVSGSRWKIAARPESARLQ